MRALGGNNQLALSEQRGKLEKGFDTLSALTGIKAGLHVEPMKPMFKAPGTTRLKLEYLINCFHVLLSNSASAAASRTRTSWPQSSARCAGRPGPRRRPWLGNACCPRIRRYR